MKKILIIIISSISIVAAGCATTPVYEGKPLIVESNTGTVMEVAINETTYIKLKSQLSTGYGWMIKSKPDFITFAEKSDVETDNNGIDGAVDYQILNFKATAAGEGEIVLLYKQPWEKEKKPERELKIKIKTKQ